MNIVQGLLGLPEGCIYALYNPNRKKVLLKFCKNSIKSIPRIISDLRNNDHTCKELISDLHYLQLIILETHTDSDYLRLRMQYWYDYVKSIGLETYTKSPVLRYKSRINVGYDYSGDQRVFVELVNRRNESFVVGVFEKMHEAKEFQTSYFVDKKYVYPVYALNELTKEYVCTRDGELDRVFKVRF